jgi:hypothetical protein
MNMPVARNQAGDILAITLPAGRSQPARGWLSSHGEHNHLSFGLSEQEEYLLLLHHPANFFLD